MMKIYTPKEWLSAFQECPSLIIDDKGLIWAGDEYYKILFGEPSGKIDFEKGYIYGEDYAKLMATPIGILEKVNDVIKVYDYQKGRFSAPVLYIENDKIYTPEQYGSIFGSDARGYVQKGKSTSGGSQKENTEKKGSFKGVDLGGAGFVIFMCLFLLIGNSIESLLENPLMLTGLIIVFAMAFLLRKVNTKLNGKENFLQVKLSSISRGMDPQWIALCKKNAAICAGLTSIPAVAASFMIFSRFLRYFSPIQAIPLAVIIPGTFFWMAYLIYRNAMVRGKMRCWPLTQVPGSKPDEPPVPEAAPEPEYTPAPKPEPKMDHTPAPKSAPEGKAKKSDDATEDHAALSETHAPSVKKQVVRVKKKSASSVKRAAAPGPNHTRAPKSAPEGKTKMSDDASEDHAALPETHAPSAKKPVVQAEKKPTFSAKRIIVIALVVIGAAGIGAAALGGNQQPQTASKNPTPALSSAQETTEAAAPETEETLTVSKHTYDDGDVLYTYCDSEGNQVKTELYGPDGHLSNLCEYTVGPDGMPLLTHQTSFYYHSDDGTYSGWIDWEYDSNGREISLTSYDEDGKMKIRTEYQYYSDGHVESYKYLGDGTLHTWEVYNADPDGPTFISGGYYTISERIQDYYRDDGTISARDEDTFDSDGNRIRTVSYYYNTDESLDRWVETTYDKDGNEISNVRHDLGE